MSKRTNIILCTSRASLIEAISNLVYSSLNEVDGKRSIITYPIQFRVEDTPGETEWAKMGKADRKNAWDCATGTYGIVNVAESFDAEGVRLAGGYYGGNYVDTCPMFDASTTLHAITRDVDTMLDAMLYGETWDSILLKYQAETF